MQVNSKSPMKAILIGVAAIVVAIGLILCAIKLMGSNSSVEGEIKRDKYQAVFLTNGQVYFCKLTNISKEYVICADIYYLQVQQKVQPKDDNEESQVSLAKLGTELHGPEDKMIINRDQVLFWENLKDDGKVVKAITENKNQ